MDGFLKFVGAIVVGGLYIGGIACLFALPTMFLINYLLAPSAIMAIYGIAKITFWKALWTNILCGFLFKGTSSSTSTKTK